METRAKRRRNNEAGKGESSGRSFSNLPNNIMETILFSLSVKMILICKSVCKSWYDLISNPGFAKLHFDQAQVYPLIRTSYSTFQSRLLYLVQPEQSDFEHKLESSDDSSTVNFEIGSKLKLPLNNIQMIPAAKDVLESTTNCMKLNMNNHKYNIINSCNGLLCLSNPSNHEPVIICNPVTGEFINIPGVKKNKGHGSPHLGFGFSPKTNEYTVIRMFKCVKKGSNITGVQLYKLGTDDWRLLSVSIRPVLFMSFPIYLNGCVYWFSGLSHSVISFHIEDECFEEILDVPPSKDDSNSIGYHDMGVLDGELFVSFSGSHLIRVWKMKNDGAKKSWCQFFSFRVNSDEPYGSYLPIKYLNNGELLMFCTNKRAKQALICIDSSKNRYRCFRLCGFESEVEAIAHVPSFVPLKHALSGHNVEVLNVSSRFPKLKLYKENKNIYIVEEVR